MRYLIYFVLLALPVSMAAQKVSSEILLYNAPGVSGMEENAIAYYTRELDRNPDNVQALILRSELYRALNRTTEADADLSAALEQNPFARIYLYKDFRRSLFPAKNYTYVSEVNNDLSQRFHKSVILRDVYEGYKAELVASDEDEVLRDVIESILQGDYASATIDLPTYPVDLVRLDIYYDLDGLLSLLNGDNERAIRSATRAISINPDMVTSYFNRGIALKKSDYLQQAEEDLMKSISLRPQMAETYFGKGKLFELQGKTKEAIRSYAAALSKRESYKEAKLNYASVLKSEGDYTKAMNAINNAIRSAPDTQENYYLRAGIHFVHGDYDRAIDDFDTYLSGGHQDKEALFFRGLCKVLSDRALDGCVDMQESIVQGYDDDQADIMSYMCE